MDACGDLLLAQGAFQPGQTLSVAACDAEPELAEDQMLLESWGFVLTDGSAAQKLRYTMPEDCRAERMLIFVQNEDGQWRQVETTLVDSCLVFAVEPGDGTFSLVEQPEDYGWMYYAAGGGIVVLVLITALVLRKKRNANRADKAEDEKMIEKDAAM